MTKRLFQMLLSICLVFSASEYVSAQTNYATIKVDELSDVQIKQLMQRAQAAGYNDSQLEQMATAQGMKQEEITKLRARVKKIRESGSGAAGSSESENKRTENLNRSYIDADSLTKVVRTSEQQMRDAFGNLIPKVFGSELFSNSSITFEPNLNIPTPKGYIIGAGDQLLIDLSGDNEANYRLNVSPDGTVRIEYLGPIAVAGLSIEAATSKIKNMLAGTYPSVRSGATRIAVNLGNIRSIRVMITGEVEKPGTFTLPSLATVYTALYASGGPSINGSFRKIQLIRNNSIVSTIDAYDFLVNGIQKGNIRLEDGDVIKVPVYANRVEVSGEVKRPAIFETLANENFAKLLEYAGGFSQEAYSASVKVLQNTDRERKVADLTSDKFTSYFPQNGDKFIVDRILDRFTNRVEISGAVSRAGIYELEPGLTIKKLIQKADGLTEDAFLGRAYINRLNADNTQAFQSFNVAKILAGTDPDIPLMREDKITINSIFDLRDEYKVTIAGEVRQPGEFDYATNMTVNGLVQMAGGFTEGATPSRIEISRRIRTSNPLSKSAITAELFMVNLNGNLESTGEPFVLEPFDIVSVRSSEGYEIQKQILLQGEVLYPGTYTIQSKMERISDVIARAGGLTANAYTDGASLRRPGPPNRTKQDDKNAVDLTVDEEREKQLTLKRLQDFSGKDEAAIAQDSAVIASDLVGIDLTQILKTPGAVMDLIVEEGDIIRVPRLLQTVKVSGEILNPNNIVYSRNKNFRDYVRGAGGYTVKALPRGAYIKYANGSVESASNFLFFKSYPRVKPGSEILVPQRPPRERMNAQAWLGIGTAIAGLATVMVTLFR